MLAEEWQRCTLSCCSLTATCAMHSYASLFAALTQPPTFSPLARPQLTPGKPFGVSCIVIVLLLSHMLGIVMHLSLIQMPSSIHVKWKTSWAQVPAWIPEPKCRLSSLPSNHKQSTGQAVLLLEMLPTPSQALCVALAFVLPNDHTQSSVQAVLLLESFPLQNKLCVCVQAVVLLCPCCSMPSFQAV